MLDQVRTVDRPHLLKRLGLLTALTLAKTLRVQQDMFAP